MIKVPSLAPALMPYTCASYLYHEDFYSWVDASRVGANDGKRPSSGVKPQKVVKSRESIELLSKSGLANSIKL
jgi:hypothetical protein